MSQPKFRLINGDALQVLDKLLTEGMKVDLIYTSPNPPFYSGDDGNKAVGIGSEESFNDYMTNLMEIFKLCKDLLKDTGHLWLHSGDYSRARGSMLLVPSRIALTLSDRMGWIINSSIIWWRPIQWHKIEADYIIQRKLEGQVNKKPPHFLRDYEMVFDLVKVKGANFYAEDNSWWKSSVYRIPYVKPSDGVWSSGYPEDLVRMAVKTCTKEGETVLDPFMGPGETGIVALKMHRNFIGIDIDKRSFELTAKRFKS